MRPFATDVACSVVCLCVFGTWVSCAKWLNRWRCRLGADSCRSWEVTRRQSGLLPHYFGAYCFFWSLFFFLLLVASNRSSCIVLHPLLLLLYYIVSYCIVFNYIVLNFLSSWHSDRSMECVQLCFRYLNLTIKMRLQTKILMSIHSNQTLRNRWMTEYINRLSVGIFVFVA